MYANYFGLTELPFSIAPNPQYLFMSKRHQEALAHLLYGVQTEGGGFILLTGEVGTGKTTLCRCLLEQIPIDVETAFVLNPRVSNTELLATIADEFGFTCDDNTSLKSLTDSLNQYLLEQHRADKRCVLIIDEAQNLSHDVLEQLRLLTNLETNERKLLQIILLGQPELGATLSQSSLRQFSQRITARYHLEALDPAETADYIEHRLKIAGGSASLFTSAAVKRIHRLTSGVPRLINLICDRSMLGAYAEDKHRITPAMVSKAAIEVMGNDRSKSYGWLAATAAVVVLSVIVGFWYTDSDIEQVPVAEKTASPEPIEVVVADNSPPEIIKPATTYQPLVVSGHDDINSAWHDLFVLWGAAFADQTTPPCELAREIGLMCMQLQVNWQELVEINRPVVVALDNQYLTLSEINNGHLTLFAGASQFDFLTTDFVERFDGTINMVWRMPPDYQAPLKRDDRGAAVDWLVLQMALIEGATPPLETGFTFNESLEDRIRHFQASVGLTPSGVVDPMTWIHINSVEAVSIPTLHQDRQG